MIPLKQQNWYHFQ